MRTSCTSMVRSLGFTKVRREIEPRWVSWYIKENYPDAEIRLRCPLGPVPDELKELYGPAKAARVYRPSRPEVDALVVLDDAILLVEAKILKYMDGLAKLPVYAALVKKTAELDVLMPRRIIMHLLLPRQIPWVRSVAQDLGVTVKIAAPQWVMDIWEDRDKYWTPTARMRREDRKAILKGLGFV